MIRKYSYAVEVTINGSSTERQTYKRHTALAWKKHAEANNRPCTVSIHKYDPDGNHITTETHIYR